MSITEAEVVKQNDHYRITKDQVFSEYFLEGKNKFGRWCLIRSLDGLNLDKVWQDLNEIWKQAERANKEKENVS
jgi:hypothetical protein